MTYGGLTVNLSIWLSSKPRSNGILTVKKLLWYMFTTFLRGMFSHVIGQQWDCCPKCVCLLEENLRNPPKLVAKYMFSFRFQSNQFKNTILTLNGPVTKFWNVGNIWAAEVIWYKTQLTGCSYLVLQSRHVLGGLTSFSNAALVFNSQMLYVRCLPRSRGVPTSFYRLIMIFLTNRGTPQYYSLFNQIKSVAHIYI